MLSFVAFASAFGDCVINTGDNGLEIGLDGLLEQSFSKICSEESDQI